MATNSLSGTVDVSGKTVEELSKWLQENGIPHEFCKKFEGECNSTWLCGTGDNGPRLESGEGGGW